MAVKATLALKAGVWFRRVRFVMISPDSRQPRCRCQAENPLIVLSRFPEPALSFIERIEHIDEELKALNEGKKEVFSEAKGEGFDVKVLKEILRLRKQDQDERDERDSLLDLYLRAIQNAAPAQAKAA